MADVWLPGAYRDPGRNAGYNSGRSSMTRAVAHYTVGSDSRNVGRDGYFHFLVHRSADREGGCTQYAEVDAITWHAADAGNPYGPGVEWERNVTGGINAEGLSDAEPLTDNQLQWGARLVTFFAEHGIPPELYDGPRYGEQSWRGWVNHQAIDSSRSDGLLRAEWYAIAGGGDTPTTETEEGDVFVMLYTGPENDGARGVYVFDGTTIFQSANVNALGPGRTYVTEHWGEIQWCVDRVNEVRGALDERMYLYDFTPTR